MGVCVCMRAFLSSLAFYLTTIIAVVRTVKDIMALSIESTLYLV